MLLEDALEERELDELPLPGEPAPGLGAFELETLGDLAAFLEDVHSSRMRMLDLERREALAEHAALEELAEEKEKLSLRIKRFFVRLWERIKSGFRAFASRVKVLFAKLRGLRTKVRKEDFVKSGVESEPPFVPSRLAANMKLIDTLVAKSFEMVTTQAFGKNAFDAGREVDAAHKKLATAFAESVTQPLSGGELHAAVEAARKAIPKLTKHAFKMRDLSNTVHRIAMSPATFLKKDVDAMSHNAALFANVGDFLQALSISFSTWVGAVEEMALTPRPEPDKAGGKGGERPPGWVKPAGLLTAEIAVLACHNESLAEIHDGIERIEALRIKSELEDDPEKWREPILREREGLLARIRNFFKRMWARLTELWKRFVTRIKYLLVKRAYVSNRGRRVQVVNHPIATPFDLGQLDAVLRITRELVDRTRAFKDKALNVFRGKGSAGDLKGDGAEIDGMIQSIRSKTEIGKPGPELEGQALEDGIASARRASATLAKAGETFYKFSRELFGAGMRMKGDDQPAWAAGVARVMSSLVAGFGRLSLILGEWVRKAQGELADSKSHMNFDAKDFMDDMFKDFAEKFKKGADDFHRQAGRAAGGNAREDALPGEPGIVWRLDAALE